jgi:glycerol-3-phosphate cytidylyltransferase
MKLTSPRCGSVVLTYGSFDRFHHGHVRFLQRLSRLGRRVIVGCATDEFNAAKGRPVELPFAQRRATLESCRYVDHVIAETCWEQKRTDIVNYDVSVLAIGENWRGQFDDLGDLAQVVYLPRTTLPHGEISALPIQRSARGLRFG